MFEENGETVDTIDHGVGSFSPKAGGGGKGAKSYPYTTDEAKIEAMVRKFWHIEEAAE